MRAEMIKELVGRQPFQPFAIHLSNGETHEVRHPKCILFGGSKVVICDADGDRFVIRTRIHVSSVRLLQAAWEGLPGQRPVPERPSGLRAARKPPGRLFKRKPG